MAFSPRARHRARPLVVGAAAGALVAVLLAGAYAAGVRAEASDARAGRLFSRQVAGVSDDPAGLVDASFGGDASAMLDPTLRGVLGPGVSTVLADARRSPIERDCLAAAVYYEARGESDAGQAAIAQVVLNRMHTPGFPKTVCGVVYQGDRSGAGCQFSFTCDGAMRKRRDPQAWSRAEQVAARALGGFVMPEVGAATHFHAAGVRPAWGDGFLRVTQVGLHVFYALSHAAPRGAPTAPDAPALATAHDADADARDADAAAVARLNAAQLAPKTGERTADPGPGPARPSAGAVS